MKKIIIVNNNLEVGGVQKSLLNLLNEIHNIYDVTLLLFRCTPEKLKLIPQNVKVITINSPFKHFGMSAYQTKKNPRLFAARAFWKVIVSIFGRSAAIRMMLPFQKKIGDYDCAISFLHEERQKSLYGGCNEFVLKRIRATKKIAWLHCDYSLCGANNKQSYKIYKQFDSIVACSEGTKKAFVKCIPDLFGKCKVVRNCNDYETIRLLAEHGEIYDKEYFNIVTVARLSGEKGIERALSAIKKCIKKGYKIKYHIIGDGKEKENLKRIVNDTGMTENVVFYGKQTNPYRYMINADLFVLTSYHEAAPMVFDEAAFLGLPIMATETTSTKEMISDIGAGYVCGNSREEIDDTLLYIVDNRDELSAIKQNLKKRKFDNKKSTEALDSVINE